MLNPTKMANAASLVTLVCYVIYLVVLTAFPNLIHIYVSSMAPGYDLSSIESNSMSSGFTLLGAAMMVLSVWVLVFATVWLYNSWGK
jgi:hypothetical protein